MTVTKLRDRLIKRLAEVEDQELLALIDRMLDRSTNEDAIGASMLSRAIEANEDIKAGRTFGYDEALERVKKSIRKK